MLTSDLLSSIRLLPSDLPSSITIA
jgi:hypothetical protein